MRMLRFLSLLLLIAGAHRPAPAAALDQAEQIAQHVYDRDDGKDSYAKVEMVLVDKKGSERKRTLEIATKDYGELTKRYIYFDSPSSIGGTGLLAWENFDRDDDQFLYLPSLRRARRVVSSQKDRAFVNTDYSYEDLERAKVERFTHRITGETPCLEKKCWILESTPKKEEYSQYGKKISHVVKDIYLPIHVEFFDRKQKHTKQFDAHEIKLMDGVWTVMSSEMKDLGEGSKTVMKTSDMKYNKGIADKIFTESYLEKRE